MLCNGRRFKALLTLSGEIVIHYVCKRHEAHKNLSLSLTSEDLGEVFPPGVPAWLRHSLTQRCMKLVKLVVVNPTDYPGPKPKIAAVEGYTLSTLTSLAAVLPSSVP